MDTLDFKPIGAELGVADLCSNSPHNKANYTMKNEQAITSPLRRPWIGGDNRCSRC